jgi:hypothetical protein
MEQVAASGVREGLKQAVGQIDAILTVGATPSTARRQGHPAAQQEFANTPGSLFRAWNKGAGLIRVGLCPLLAPGLPGS